MDRNEFDNYLSSRFEKANRSKTETYFSSFQLNYGPFLPSNKMANILDIGCGMGQFIRYLQKNGYTNVSGIELGQEAVDYCRKNGLENVSKIDNLSEFLSKNRGKFDFIILKSVIAHFPRENVIPNLKLIRDSLAEDGMVLIETFNISVLTGMFAFYDDFTHKIGFTGESLFQVLYEAGFKDIRISGNKYKIKGIKSFIWVMGRKIWTILLRTIYILERGIGDNPKILSKLLIAVAKK